MLKTRGGKFGLQKMMRNDDGVFLFKFASKTGMEQVLERGPWMIHNSPIILTKWSPNLPLTKGEVTKVPVWIKLHRVPILAYSEDGLSLIATQIGTPLMLDAFTSSMCVESWGRISFARALVEVNADAELKQEVVMAIPEEDGNGYIRETIRVEYEWKPPHCVDCKVFGHTRNQCPYSVKEGKYNTPTTDTTNDGFMKVTRKKSKGMKADQQSRVLTRVELIWLVKSSIDQENGPSTSNSFDILNKVDVGDECGVSSSMGTASKQKSSTWNEEFDSDDEVDEVIFPEGNKWDDQFDIRLKGRVRK
ncbi:reverse transcriptase domain-containing protein [Tanacetum coccineum]